jgi:hypothetical protein
MDLVKKAKQHWFVGILGIAILCISATWVVAWEIFDKLREYDIKKIEDLKSKITSLENELTLCRENLEKCLDNMPKGRILLPQEGEAVPMEFSVEVEIIQYTPGRHYYLVNEVHGLYWPKFEINPNQEDRIITGQIVEAGKPPRGIFYLVLIEVDEDDHQRLREYFKGKTHPGIKLSAKILHRIKLKLK